MLVKASIKSSSIALLRERNVSCSWNDKCTSLSLPFALVLARSLYLFTKAGADTHTRVRARIHSHTRTQKHDGCLHTSLVMHFLHVTYNSAPTPFFIQWWSCKNTQWGCIFTCQFNISFKNNQVLDKTLVSLWPAFVTMYFCLLHLNFYEKPTNLLTTL